MSASDSGSSASTSAFGRGDVQAGRSFEEIGTRRAQQQHRGRGEVCDVLDEVEKRRLGPVQVVEDDDEWTSLRERLEVATARPLRLLLGAGDAVEANRCGNPVRDEIVPGDRRDRRPIRAGGRSDDLRERPVRDPLPVRETPADDETRIVAEPLDELADEAGLADSRRSQAR